MSNILSDTSTKLIANLPNSFLIGSIRSIFSYVFSGMFLFVIINLYFNFSLNEVLSSYMDISIVILRDLLQVIFNVVFLYYLGLLGEVFFDQLYSIMMILLHLLSHIPLLPNDIAFSFSRKILLNTDDTTIYEQYKNKLRREIPKYFAAPLSYWEVIDLAKIIIDKYDITHISTYKFTLYKNLIISTIILIPLIWGINPWMIFLNFAFILIFYLNLREYQTICDAKILNTIYLIATNKILLSKSNNSNSQAEN